MILRRIVITIRDGFGGIRPVPSRGNVSSRNRVRAQLRIAGILMASSDLEIIEQDGVTVVVLGEEYDNLEEMVLERASKHLLEIAKSAEPPLILIDMTKTKFFGSAFLGTLFRVWRRLSARNGKMAVCCATGWSRKCLRSRRPSDCGLSTTRVRPPSRI